MFVSKRTLKNEYNSNPISACIFCADPTAIEFEGRLYVYGTNDNQQFEESDVNSSNTYDKIISLVCFSTDDMCNWTYHGIIDVKRLSPWAVGAWAPVVIKRIEKDGLTHFYLYFSNNGCGVGVLTSTSPLGPWTAPIKKPLVNFDMRGLHGVHNPFHPGVCMDDKGDAYLVCGGGYTKNGDDFMPGTVRIARLNSNLTSFSSKFYEIKAPYFFENNEIYFLNGTYIYSYNNNWVERKRWNMEGISAPSACSISYMTSKNPLETDSWEYKGHYFKNPGEMGLNYCNNHVYFCKYKSKYYLFYHELSLQKMDSTYHGYRSICVDEINIDEENVNISMCNATKKGVEAVGKLNPFDIICGTTMFNCENIECLKVESYSNQAAVKVMCDNAWIEVKNVDFEDSAAELFLQVKGKGTVSLHMDRLKNTSAVEINCDSKEYTELSACLKNPVSGVHNIFFVFHMSDNNDENASSENLFLKNWSVK